MHHHSEPTIRAIGPGARLDMLVARVSRQLMETDFDCLCRDSLEQRLQRLAEESRRDEVVAALVQARGLRAAIARLLSFLDDLDDFGPDEPDISAFAEAAGIFDDINQAAANGAVAMRRAAAMPAAAESRRAEPDDD